MTLQQIMIDALNYGTPSAQKEYGPEEGFRLLQAWRQHFERLVDVNGNLLISAPVKKEDRR